MLIIRAAVLYSNGEIVEGRDYGYINAVAKRLSLTGDKIDGYITSSGEFVLPSDATSIAIKSGQVSEDVGEITPDSLWPQRLVDTL